MGFSHRNVPFVFLTVVAVQNCFVRPEKVNSMETTGQLCEAFAAELGCNRLHDSDFAQDRPLKSIEFFEKSGSEVYIRLTEKLVICIFPQ